MKEKQTTKPKRRLRRLAAEWSPLPLVFHALPGQPLYRVPFRRRQAVGETLFFTDIANLAENTWDRLGGVQRPGVLVVEARTTFPRRAIPDEVVSQVCAALGPVFERVLRGNVESDEAECKTDWGICEFFVHFEERRAKESLDEARENLHSETVLVGEPADQREPVPSPTREKAQVAFDTLVEKLTTERQQQAARLQPVLSAYLRQWDEEQQRLTREREDRPAEEIARAKKELVERVNAALGSLDISIYRDGQPCNLIVAVGDSNRRGVFWLKPKGSGKPLDHKANLSNLFNFREGEPQLAVDTPRREALAEWHEREQARRKTGRSAERRS